MLYKIIGNISKLIVLIISIYYIENKEEYIITINYLPYLFEEDVIKTINEYVSFIGTSILIMSWLLKNKVINILAYLFTTSEGIFGIIGNINKETLIEVTNFKLFTVYQILSLEKKKAIFLEEYKNVILSLTDGVNEKVEYLNKELFNNNRLFNEIIKNLSSIEIMLFSNKLITKLLKEYDYNQAGILVKFLQYIIIKNLLLTV